MTKQYDPKEFALTNPNRPKCKTCKKNVALRQYYKHVTDGKRFYWIDICTSCRRKNEGKPIRKSKYKDKVNKGLICSLCPFIAEHKCQIDIDHIDGNHSNNLSENLQQICANCHRLKTQLNKDYLPK